MICVFSVLWCIIQIAAEENTTTNTKILENNTPKQGNNYKLPTIPQVSNKQYTKTRK